MSDLIVPTVHSNGTSGEYLLDQNDCIVEALRNVLDTMRMMPPNGRDFYPKGNGVSMDAHKAFAERYATICRVLDDFLEVGDGIRKQIE
jgi:hypothetical protein